MKMCISSPLEIQFQCGIQNIGSGEGRPKRNIKSVRQSEGGGGA